MTFETFGTKDELISYAKTNADKIWLRVIRNGGIWYNITLADATPEERVEYIDKWWERMQVIPRRQGKPQWSTQAVISINEWATKINKIAHEHGWYDDGPRNFGELLALMHSELSEALEEWRDNKGGFYIENGKPEGYIVEMIDCAIRILDTVKEMGFNVEEVMSAKVAYNEGRPYKHGGKRC
jgi:hypothetical protein